MDFAGRCHSDLLLSPSGEKKALLRNLARQLHAPKEVTDGAKRGFNAPLAGLLRRALRPTAERIFEHEAEVLDPFIDPGEPRRLWRANNSSLMETSYSLQTSLLFACSES